MEKNQIARSAPIRNDDIEYSDRPNSTKADTTGIVPNVGLFVPAARKVLPDPLDAVLKKLHLDRSALTVEACESLCMSAPQILGTNYQPRLEDQDDRASVVSTSSDYQDSVFSVESSETSATAFSRNSGFSVEQTQSATRVFVSILQEDDVLKPLYEFARNNTRIRLKRLRRHIRAVVKAYAENLKEEANDHLGFSAFRLVHTRARYAAQCIASEEDIYRHSQNLVNDRTRTSKDAEDSSEEETAERTVDETDFGDLKSFRMFLTGSNAFVALREQTHAFYTTNSKTPQYRPTIGSLKLAPDVTSDSQIPQSIQHPHKEIHPSEKYRKNNKLKPPIATRSNIKYT
jgi:hypothetical protein